MESCVHLRATYIATIAPPHPNQNQPLRGVMFAPKMTRLTGSFESKSDAPMLPARCCVSNPIGPSGCHRKPRRCRWGLPARWKPTARSRCAGTCRCGPMRCSRSKQMHPFGDRTHVGSPLESQDQAEGTPRFGQNDWKSMVSTKTWRTSEFSECPFERASNFGGGHGDVFFQGATSQVVDGHESPPK